MDIDKAIDALESFVRTTGDKPEWLSVRGRLSEIKQETFRSFEKCRLRLDRLQDISQMIRRSEEPLAVTAHGQLEYADRYEFQMTASHVALLRNMRIDWGHWGDAEHNAFSDPSAPWEHGAPSLDMKAPYGDRDVLKSIKDLAHHSAMSDADAKALHLTMLMALQVCLSAGSFGRGTYVLSKQGSGTWERVL